MLLLLLFLSLVLRVSHCSRWDFGLFCQLVSFYWNSVSVFAVEVICFCGFVACTNVNTIVQLVVLVCSSGAVSFKASAYLPCYLALVG